MRYSILIALIVLCSCSNEHRVSGSASSQLQLPEFNKEGHRGTRGLMPENTITAMYKAIDLGVNTVEVDVVFSKDMQVVISHDVYFHQDITTTPDGKTLSAKEAPSYLLYNMTYDSIRKYDVGLKGHPDFPNQLKQAAYKPLLSELVDSVDAYAKRKGRKIIYNIELKTNPAHDNNKTPAVDVFVDKVMEIVNQKQLTNRAYLQSFDFRPLQILHKKYPEVTTAVLISGSEKRPLEEQLKEIGYEPKMYSPHYSIVTAALAQACHVRNIKLIPWTVNTLEEMKKMKAVGVDGIITDYPNLFDQL